MNQQIKQQQQQLSVQMLANQQNEFTHPSVRGQKITQPLILNTDEQFLERVNNYIDHTMNKHVPPFDEDEIKNYSAYKASQKINIPKQNTRYILLGEESGKKSGSRGKQKKHLSDWRSLLQVQKNLVNRKQIQKSHKGTPVQHLGNKKATIESLTRVQQSQNSKKCLNQKRYIESALVQNFYETELVLENRPQTTKVHNYYQNSERRPISMNSSYRIFMDKLGERQSSPQANYIRNKTSQNYYKSHNGTKKSRQPHSTRHNRTALYPYRPPKDSEQIDEKFELFENIELKNVSIKPFTIIGNLDKKSQNERGNKSRFLKDIMIKKWQKIKFKEQYIQQQHCPVEREGLQVNDFISKQQEKNKCKSGVEKFIKGFQYCGKNSE